MLTASEEVGLSLLITAGDQARAELAELAPQPAPPEQPAAGQADEERAPAPPEPLAPDPYRRLLAAQIRDGENALAIFCQANSGMVVTIVDRVMRRVWYLPRVERPDVESEALAKLIGHIRGFDPSMGFKFSTYAMTPMYTETLAWALEYGRIMHQSRGARERLTGFQRRIADGVEPEVAASEAGLGLETMLDHERAAKVPDAVSYDRLMIPGDETSTPFIDQVANPPTDATAEEIVNNRLSAAAIVQALRDWLRTTSQSPEPDRAFQILFEHYGHGTPQKDLAAERGRSPQAISKAIGSALAKLHRKLPPELRDMLKDAGYSIPDIAPDPSEDD